MMNDKKLNENIARVRTRLANAARNANRAASDIRLIAVSKTKPVDAIREAFRAGVRDFGENYVSEGVEKCQQCRSLDITWHFLGPLQSNKTRLVAEHFDWIHSVDRLKTLTRLNAQRPSDKAPLKVCLQVNIPQEPSKSGVSSPAELTELALAALEFERLELCGIMAIPAPTADRSTQLAQFERIASLLNIDTIPPQMCELSMGMSADMEPAITAGSTMVRVGTDIFGARYT